MKVKNEQTTVISRAEVRKLIMDAAGIRDEAGFSMDFDIPESVTLTYVKESDEKIRPPQVKR